MAFIDFKAVSDLMSHCALRNILQSVGVPEKFRHLICTLYTDTCLSICLASPLSEQFTVDSGVKQGCSMSPDLFNSIIEHLPGSSAWPAPSQPAKSVTLTQKHQCGDAREDGPRFVVLIQSPMTWPLRALTSRLLPRRAWTAPVGEQVY